MKVLLISNDQTIEITELQDRNAGTYITTAAVEAEIFDKTTGLQVGSSITMSFVVGTLGTYRGNIPHSTALISGRRYTINITADQGGTQGYWVEEAQAQYRH